MSKVIETLERRQLRDGIPRFKAGDTVRVHFRVIEGQRSCIQVFEGIVLKRQGSGARDEPRAELPVEAKQLRASPPHDGREYRRARPGTVNHSKTFSV